MWHNFLGHCVLKADFPKGKKETCSVIVSGAFSSHFSVLVGWNHLKSVIIFSPNLLLSSEWFWCCSMMHKSWASLTSRIPLVSRIKNWQEHWALQSLACGEVRGSPKGVILICRLIIILGFQYAASLIVTCRVIVFLTLILFQCPKGLSEGVVYYQHFGWGGSQDLLFEFNTCFLLSYVN